MNQSGNKPGPRGGEPTDDEIDAEAGSGKTPSTDIQPEDTGTPRSGNTGRGTAAEEAMKHTSKTGNERSSKR